jgi:hypothetical protein
MMTNVQKVNEIQCVITDLEIQALVDNPEFFAADERLRLMDIVAGNTSLRKRYEELRWQKRLLQLWWEGNTIQALH